MWFRILIEILPLALGASISPLVLILQLLQLARPGARLLASWCFVAGNLVVLLFWSAAGRALGHLLQAHRQEIDPMAADLEMVLALLLFSLGLKQGLLKVCPMRPSGQSLTGFCWCSPPPDPCPHRRSRALLQPLT